VRRSRDANDHLRGWRQVGRLRRILDDAQAGSSGFTPGWRGARRLGSSGGAYRADRGTRSWGHGPGSGRWSLTGPRAAPVPRRGRRRCGRKNRRPGRPGHLRRRARPRRRRWKSSSRLWRRLNRPASSSAGKSISLIRQPSGVRREFSSQGSDVRPRNPASWPGQILPSALKIRCGSVTEGGSPPRTLSTRPSTAPRLGASLGGPGLAFSKFIGWWGRPVSM